MQLLRRKFLLLTLKGRRARWIMNLPGYDFEVQHRPGTHNCNVDALSRLPFQIKTDLSGEILSTPVVPTASVCLTMLANENNIKRTQLADPRNGIEEVWTS